MSQARDIHKLINSSHPEVKLIKEHIEKHPECIHLYEFDISVLERAILIERLDIVRLLIESGMHVDARDTAGMTSLHLAAIDGNIEMTSLLIDLGAEVHLTDKDGWSAIHYAISSENQAMIELILERGVDWNVKTKSKPEKDLLDFAKTNGGETAAWFEGVIKAAHEREQLEDAVKGEAIRSHASASKTQIRL